MSNLKLKFSDLQFKIGISFNPSLKAMHKLPVWRVIYSMFYGHVIKFGALKKMS